jgi:hypothetical protein
VGANLITPWNVNDITEAWRSDGAGLGVLAGIGAFWGVSAKSYQDKPAKGPFKAPALPKPQQPTLR